MKLMRTDEERVQELIARCREAITERCAPVYIHDSDRDMLIRILSSIEFPRAAPLPRQDRIALYRRIAKRQLPLIRHYFKEALGWSVQALRLWYAVMWHAYYGAYCAVRVITG